jgi:multiple sugar transport system substrate-binding protein
MRKALLVVSSLMALVTACDSESTSGPASSRSTPSGEISVQVSGEAEETAVYEAAVKAFEDPNDNISVELIKVADGDDHLAKLTTAFAGANPPDVFLINYREYAQFVTRGAVTDIDSLADGRIDFDLYYEQPVDAFTFDGAIQCMPQNISSLVVYYNSDLFKKAGIRRPRHAWSWEEFRAAGLKLTNGEVRGLGIDPQIIRIAPFVWSNGGEITDDPDSPTTFTLDSPEAREALEFIVSLVRDDRIVPSEEELAAQDPETRFATGKLAMLLSSRRDTPVFREVQGLNWDVLPLPVADEPAGILHSDAYCIAAGSDNKEAALEFVRFITGQEGQTLTAFGGRTVPSLRSVAESGAFLDPTQEPRHSEVFLEGVPFIRRTPVISTWPEIESVSEELLTRLFYEEGYTVDDFLRDLKDQTDPLFAEAAQG